MTTDPHAGVTLFELIVLLESDSAAGILAVAALREERAKLAIAGHGLPWRRDGHMLIAAGVAGGAHCGVLADACGSEVAAHLFAEANPAHALAAVRRWRGVVERHVCIEVQPVGAVCKWCLKHTDSWPCPDLTETADEAKAYLGGSQ